ncbi:hypothetical protein AcW1_009717 [Taiwanofungus camphoratus]|nr:hypothetical protein AcW1_009717 [Antrodia cinnamomea]
MRVSPSASVPPSPTLLFGRSCRTFCQQYWLGSLPYGAGYLVTATSVQRQNWRLNEEYTSISSTGIANGTYMETILPKWVTHLGMIMSGDEIEKYRFVNFESQKNRSGGIDLHDKRNILARWIGILLKIRRACCSKVTVTKSDGEQ